MTKMTRFSQFEAALRKFDLSNQNLKILDAGAGEQRNRQFVHRNTYISQDFGEYTGGGSVEYFDTPNRQKWNSNTCDIICDIVDIPLDSNSIDLVICTEVFEHLPRPEAAFAELLRVLKPDGLLLLTVPNLSHRHQEPYYYYSGFSSEIFFYWASAHSARVTDVYEEGSLIDHLLLETYLLPKYQATLLRRLLIKACSYPACILLKIIRYLLSLKGYNSPFTNTGLFLTIQKNALK